MSERQVNVEREVGPIRSFLPLRATTWNIRTGVGNHPGTGEPAKVRDLERIAEVMRAVRPDVVGLQEVDRHRDRSGFVDQAMMIAGMLGLEGVFAPNLVDEAGEFGVATFSRFPIIQSEHVRFPAAEGWEPRGLLDVTVDVGSSPVRIMNTHLQVGFDGRDQEAALQRADAAMAIAIRARASSVPVIVMGDFNADLSSEAFGALGFLTDAWEEREGTGYTFPASPVVEARERIDGILVSREFLVRDALVLVNGETRLTSDHYPVVADLTLVDERG